MGGGNIITPVDSIKILGVYIDQNLTFNEHNRKMSSCLFARSKSLFNYIEKHFGRNNNSQTFRCIYTGYIVSIITYCAAARMDSLTKFTKIDNNSLSTTSKAKFIKYFNKIRSIQRMWLFVINRILNFVK